MGEQGFEGLRISHYSVLDRLGAGGMGEVYRAQDLDLRRFVALKFLPLSLTSGVSSGSGLSRADVLQRFRREAQAVAALNHPGICTIFEIGEWNGQPFIAMELLEGSTLRDKLAEVAPAPLEFPQILDWGTQIAGALDAAHQQGVIHRDLKPANLFVTTRGRAKILDFGLAKRKPLAREKAGVGGSADPDETSAISWGLENNPTISAEERELTNPGSLLGTIAYMSPEQALGEPVDERTDIFSLGAVLYEMATGSRAFKGATLLAVSNAIINHDPEPAARLNPNLPTAFVDLIEKCLAKNPDERYRASAELRADLELLETGLEVETVPKRTRTPKKRDRRQLLMLLVGGLLAVSLLALARPASRGWIIARADRVLNRSHAPALPRPVNLVVLPFTGIISDPKLVAFGNGIANELTARLVQLTLGRSFQITPAIIVREKHITTLDQARRQFGSNVGLEIDLQRADGITRVSYTLIDARTGSAIRGDSVAAPDSDLIALEDRVLESVAQSLDLGLGSEERRAESFRGTRSSAAYDFYVQGIGYLQESLDPAKLSSAVETLREAVRLDPRFGLAEAALGEAYWTQYASTKDQQWIEPARTACAQAIALGNSGAEGHQCLGTLANGTGDYTTAAAQFQLAVQLDPTSDRAYDNLAQAYINLNRPGDAEKTYQHAISLRPGYWYAYNKLAIFYYNQQDYSKARDMFQKVIEMAPDSYQGYVNVGAMDLALDDVKGATSALERSIEIQPSETAYAVLGTAYFLQGDYRKAVREFEEKVRLDPNAADSWGYLADACYYAGDRARAMTLYRRAVELDEDALKVNPNDASVLAFLASYHAMLGEKDKAKEDLNRALAFGRLDQSIQFQAGEVYNDLGETEVALEWLAKAVAAGYSPYVIDHAPEFNNLHDDPRYRQLLGRK